MSDPSSNARETASANWALKRQAELDMQNMRVEASDGAVGLEGKIHSLTERHVAEQAVWAAPGIREVRDRLSII